MFRKTPAKTTRLSFFKHDQAMPFHDTTHIKLKSNTNKITP